MKIAKDIVLDETDIALLRILQQDGGVSNLELARRVNLSPPATHTRVKRLQQYGYIRQVVALVNRELLGLNLLCFIQVSIQLHQFEYAERFYTIIQQFPEVLECHHITGEYDYLLKIVVRDHRELEKFVIHKLTPIPGVAKLHTSLVFREVKTTTALPLAEAE
ncbi:MAG: Lrp/AsnC family transcriptional regulator [Chloroflexi bacterium]|nr:Lrp/AsnC family transcriptional regulator [Chloroflexota bacterium]